MMTDLTALIAKLEKAKDSAMARHGHYPSVIDDAVVFLRALEQRQGCVCSCCDHGEGSDCACDCHATGRCSDDPAGDERLREYVQHKDTCAIHDCAVCAKGFADRHDYVEAACDCGLDAPLTAAPVQAEKEYVECYDPHLGEKCPMCGAGCSHSALRVQTAEHGTHIERTEGEGSTR